MKLAYLCKYVPVELPESMGIEMVRMTPDVTDFERADQLLHPNLCSFIKAALEEYAAGDYDGIVLTNCCDSSRRLYDCIREEFPERFSHLLDVPRMMTKEASALYADAVGGLAEHLEKYTGRTFEEDRLRHLLKQTETGPDASAQEDAAVHLILIGARIGAAVRQMIREYDVMTVADLTCTETERRYLVGEDEPLKEAYASALLNQFPCMRMADIGERMRRLQEVRDRADGILYHTMKFCDMYSYEFASLNRDETLPVLKIDTDSTPQAAGQIRTRLEAFFESILQARGLPPEKIRKVKLPEGAGEDGNEESMFWKKKENSVRAVKKRRGSGPVRKEDIRVVGIDSGSTSTNAVLINGDREILSSVVIRTGSKSIVSAEDAYRQVVEKAGVRPEDVNLLISTGYGRVNLDFADRDLTEISCHGRGANYFNPEVRTILDIGGQDSKAIRIDQEGNVLDFAMNDKCAAGTGRFLEMMASTLSVSLDELGPLSLDWKEDIDISSMCSVFAESEVISLIADNKEKADIAHGVHKSIASRAVSLMKRVGMDEGFMMTGGVAKNQGAVREIEKKLGHHLYICENPEIVGAVGAALFGLDELLS